MLLLTHWCHDYSTIDDGSAENLRELANVDLSQLKSREIDMLEAIFALWSRDLLPAEDEEEECALDKFWDFRLRQLLQDRFDVKASCGECACCGSTL